MLHAHFHVLCMHAWLCMPITINYQLKRPSLTYAESFLKILLQIVQYLKEFKSANFGPQKHVPSRTCADSPVFEGISIRKFWSTKTGPVNNLHRQSSIWGKFNPSMLVGKNMFRQKCARTVQYLRESQFVNFGRQKHVLSKMCMDSPVIEGI